MVETEVDGSDLGSGWSPSRSVTEVNIIMAITVCSNSVERFEIELG